MNDSDRIDPGHSSRRNVLRLVGPIVFIMGLFLAIISAASLFVDRGNFTPQNYFWMGFVGLPLMFVGGVLSSMGYMGAVLRYQAAEAAPVGKDAINYVADGIKPAIKGTAQAFVEGIAEGIFPKAHGQYCTQCGSANDADANFCKSCGRPIPA